MNNAIAQKFTPATLLKFTLPTIIMMVFMSLYTMVDGVFVSNFVNQNALSAINIIYPAISVVIAIAIMLASGGSAVISRNMGMGQHREAKENFTLIVAVGVLIGILLIAVGYFYMPQILKLLGTTELLSGYCRSYYKVLLFFTPFSILQMLFQFFFVTAGRPNLGLWSTIVGGIANTVLDYVFIVPLKMGIEGAALATGIGYSIPAVFGLFWFVLHKKGTLHFVKPRWSAKVLLQSCFNGSSEMVTNLATAMTTLLFNIVMLKYLGENGVAAVTVVLYSQFLLTAVYLGFSSGVAPIFGYNYGEQNVLELKKVFKICMIFLSFASVAILIFSFFAASAIVSVFVGHEPAVFALALRGFLLFSVNYLFAGFNIFASSMFTAFSNGLISAIISFLRTFVFIVLCILLLPSLLGVDGIWLAVPVAEALTFGFSAYFLLKYRSLYHYL